MNFHCSFTKERKIFCNYNENTKGGSRSLLKLLQTKYDNPAIDIFFTPMGNTPICNQPCKDYCYVYEHYTSTRAAITADEVPELISRFKMKGFRIFYLITTELLLAPNWKDIIKAIGDTYVNTNGRIIVAKGLKLLDEMAEIGIKQIVITANITKSHKRFNLTPEEIVREAFSLINVWNQRNPNRMFNTVATVILTSENYDRVPEICDHVHKVYKANNVKFMTFVPFSKNVADLVLSLDQLKVSINQIKEMRKKYSPRDLYIQRDGTLGSQELNPAKLSSLCPAGAIYTFTSLSDDTPVNPCVFIPSFPIGYIKSGEINIDREKYNQFKQIKSQLIEIGYCPAHAIGTIRFAPFKFPLEHREIFLRILSNISS